MKQLILIFTILIIATITGWGQQRTLTVEDMFKMGRVSDPQISPNSQWIAYTISYYSMAENNSNTDIYLVSADGQTHRQLTNSPKRDTHPRWSKDGRHLYFLTNRNGTSQIFKIDISGGEAQQITQLPLSISSFAISPDEQYFAVQLDMYPEASTPEESAEIANKHENDKATGKIIDELLYRHWNSWRDGKKQRVMVISANDSSVVGATPAHLDCPPISLGSSHDFVWSPNGQELAFTQNADKVVAVSTNNDIWLINKDGSRLRQLTLENGNDNGPHFSPDGKQIAYLSMARPGFEADQQDLIVLDLTTGNRRNLTESLDRSVSDFKWSADGKTIYFYVPHHGRHRLYAATVKNGELKLLLDNHYLNGFDVSPNGKFIVLNHQKSNMPNELFYFDLKTKHLTRLTMTNDERIAEIAMNPIEDYWFTGAKGDSVHLMLIKPPHFDPSKKYPMINLIHGGPQGAWGDDFHYRWNAQNFAAPGYVVIMINFHGSRGYGQNFCDAVTQDWGGAPFEDIIKGTKWAAEKFAFIDNNRIGAAGASYGGFMINWIEGHNDDVLFKVLVSHDGVYELVSMFGATEELWFPRWEFNGNPWEPESLYQKWNPANYAANFKTPMLVIHGELDYRVPYTQGLQLFTALQLNNVPSRLLFFPDEDHFVSKPQNARLWWHTVHDWLAQYLSPGK